MSEVEERTGDTSDISPVVMESNNMVANIAAMTNGVTELQMQIQQLQEQVGAPPLEGCMPDLEIAAPNVAITPEITSDGLAARVQRLERELQTRTEERENYKNKLHAAEKQIVDLQSELQLAKQTNMSNVNLEDQSERSVVQETLEKLTSTLKESTEQCERFERQNTQYQSQVKALKEVIAVHKDLLSIRGMESEQLKTTIKLLEDHSKAEKERRAAVLAKMEAAVRLNSELKTEYETQLKIFGDLKGKYELKVELMNAENCRLKKLIPVEEESLENAEPVIEEQVAVEEPVVE